MLRFNFIKATNNPGTYFYHGHSGPSRSDGLTGAFIILDPIESNPTENDFVVHLMDWYPNFARDYYWRDSRASMPYVYGDANFDRCYLVPRDVTGAQTTSVAPWFTVLDRKLAKFC